MSGHDPEIQLIDLCKRYGEETAVDKLSLALPSRTIFCLLGRNGAGKTSTIHTIMGLKNPSSGEVRIRGVSVLSPEIHRVRMGVGYLPEDPVLYGHLTGREFLQFMGELYRVERDRWDAIERFLEDFGMTAHANALIRTYSLGMKKKIAFLASILPDPGILILDEPTGALDAVSAREVKRIMEEFRDRGRLVLFTTHIMEVAERLADRIAILRRGALCFEGSLAELRASHGRTPQEALEDLFVRITGEGADSAAGSEPSPSRDHSGGPRP